MNDHATQLAKAVLDMAERDKGLTLDGLVSLLNEYTKRPVFHMEVTAKAIDKVLDAAMGQAPQPQKPAVMDRAAQAVKNHEDRKRTLYKGEPPRTLTQYTLSIIQDRLQEDFNQKVDMFQEVFDCGGKVGIACQLADGRRNAVKLGRHTTLDEVIEGLKEGLI